jgi:hypothetical protein
MAGQEFVVNLGTMDTGMLWVGANCGGYSEVESSYSNNWTAGYAPGTTTITVQSTANIQVGQIIGLDELYDGSNIVLGTESSPGAYLRECGNRPIQEFKQVTAISGNNLTISPGLYSPFWSSNLAPAIFWPSSSPNYTLYHAGIESLTVDGGGYTKFALNMGVALACWASNVTVEGATSGAGCADFASQFTVNCEFRHGVMTGQPLPPASGNEGVSVENTSAFRFEDNMITNYYNAIDGVAISGCVFAFNYFTNDESTAYYPSSDVGDPTGNFFWHGGHSAFNLIEGNWARHQMQDNNYGNSVYSIAFRNRLTGFETANGGVIGSRAIRLEAHTYFYTGVGNVLGTTGHTTDYEGYTGDDVWCFDDHCGFTCDTRVDDPRVTNTLFRAGNWDAVHGSNWWNGVTVQTISNSLAYASKPSWFGNRPWPPFDPSNASAATPTNIPAGYRFLLGVDPPSGVVGPPTPPANLIVQ